MEIERYNDRGFLSDAIARGDQVWIAGTVSNPEIGSIEGQTLDVLTEIDKRLAMAGSSKAELVSVTVWLADLADWHAMNQVWIEWLGDAPSPARAVVGAALLSPFKVEIAAVAVRTLQP